MRRGRFWRRCEVLVIPLGATENHGPHLPPETDTLIADGIADRLEKRTTSDRVFFDGARSIGYSPEHMGFETTRSATPTQLISDLLLYTKDCLEWGVDRFLFLNAHGGNVPIAQIVCQELRARHCVLAVSTKWDRFVKGFGIVSGEEEALGIHGGEIETSVLLALHPDRVDMRAAADFPSLQSQLIERHTHLRAYGPHAFGWMAHDLNPNGVVGNASRATAATGERLLDVAVTGLLELIADMEAFDLAQLRNLPTLGQTK